MARTAVVVLTWNDLIPLKRTLQTFRQFNGDVPMYVVDNGSVDRTPIYLARNGYRVIRHKLNLGIFTGTMTGWSAALEDGYEFILNLQSDFPSMRPVPFKRLEAYMDHNPDVGFVRLNRKKPMKQNRTTHQPIVYHPWEPIGRGFRVAKYNYHMAFHPYLFRAEFVPHLSQSPIRTERGLMAKYEELGKCGGKLMPECFDTVLGNRHDTPGWLA